MPTKKGIRKPRHKPENKELAVSLYVSNSGMTLKEVASQLNDTFNFDPPLSYDSVGRWVQEKKEKMKRPGDLIWVKRRKKYGKSGMKREKREALSRLRTVQWSNAKYKEDMSKRMSRIGEDVKKRIVELYGQKIMPSEIRRTLKHEQRQVLGLSTIHQILNKCRVKKWHKYTFKPFSSFDSLEGIPCLTCMLNKDVSPFDCFPASCQRLDDWLFSLD